LHVRSRNRTGLAHDGGVEHRISGDLTRSSWKIFAARAAAAVVIIAACGGAPAPREGGDFAPHRFAHADEWAKAFDSPDRDAWQHPDDVIAALALEPAMTVADIGAGTGYFTVRLARAVPEGAVVATDLEPDMVRYLRERAARERLENVHAQLAAGDDPKLDAASVDRILVVDVWHHVADRRRYAAGLARALRPGGVIAIVDFTAEATRGPPKAHRLAPDMVIADLAAAGMHASLSPIQLPEQYIVLGKN
jgi:SAM-dependent methyltransferase